MKDAFIITGASTGLGEEFARQLAPSGHNLVLTARSADRLDAIATELRARYPIEVRTCPLDLAEPGAARELVDWLEREGIEPAWLINNAGFGGTGHFARMDPATLCGIMMVNMIALTELTRLLIPRLREHPRARILNVASTAAFQPVPFFGVYAATKAYVLSFSEALHEELLDSTIRVSCLCPGPTSTEFNRRNGIRERAFRRAQTSQEVVRMGITGAEAGRAVIVCQNRLVLVLDRLLPRFAIRKIAAALVKPSISSNDNS